MSIAVIIVTGGIATVDDVLTLTPIFIQTLWLVTKRMELRHLVGSIDRAVEKGEFSKPQQLDAFHNIIHAHSPGDISGCDRADIFSRVVREEKKEKFTSRWYTELSGDDNDDRRRVRIPQKNVIRPRNYRRCGPSSCMSHRDSPRRRLRPDRVGRDVTSVRQPSPTQDAVVVLDSVAGAAQRARTLSLSLSLAIPNALFSTVF